MTSNRCAPFIAASWLAELHQIGKLHSWDPSDRILWITSEQISSRALQGLQLMRLLGRSDVETWKKLALALWGNGSGVAESDLVDALSTTTPTVGLRVNVDCLAGALHMFQPMASGDWGAQRLILKRGDTSDKPPVDDRTPIRFFIEYDNCSSRGLPNLLQPMLELFSTQESSTQAPALAQLVQNHFRLDQISVKWISDEHPEEIRGFEMPTEADTWINNSGTLCISKFANVSRDAATKLSQFLSPVHCGVVHVWWRGEVTQSMVPVFLSAVRFSTVAQTFLLDLRARKTRDHKLAGSLDKHSRRLLWQWLAFALYCTGAKHSVRNLDFSMDVQDEDATAVREVLAAKNPLAVLFGGDPSAEPIGQISTTRFYLDKPGIKPTRLWINATPITADVIHYPVEGVYEVLLPGYGGAWVHDDDVLQFDTAAALHQPSAITTVGFFLEDINVDAQLALVEIIGGPVTHLDLGQHYGEGNLQPAWYHRTFIACPRLVALNTLSCRTDSSSLAAIADACVAGICHLSHLKIYVDQHHGSQELVDFINVLCDSQHPLTKSLKKLHLGVYMRYRIHVRFLNAVFDLLEQSRSLAKLVVDIKDTGHVVFMEEFIRKSWKEHAADPGLYHIKSPITVKVAFLSVLQELPVYGLDSAVVSLVFQFAGHLIQRTAYLDYLMLDEASDADVRDGQYDEDGNDIEGDYSDHERSVSWQ